MNRIKAYLRRHHLAMLALFIALGGTSYAATALPRNSVGPNQIRSNAVGTSEIRSNAVTGSKIPSNAVGASEIKANGVRSSEVLDGSLLARDFRSGELPRGATGPQGPAGGTGPAGPAGPANIDTTVPAVRLQLNGSQSVPAGPGGQSGSAILRFSEPTSEQYDIGGFFDPATPAAGREPGGDAVLIIPRDGTYLVTAGVRWATNAAGSRTLNLSGPQPGGVRASSTVPAADVQTRQTVVTTDRFKAGDRLYLSVSQTSGVDVAVEGSQSQVHFSAAFVGA